MNWLIALVFFGKFIFCGNQYSTFDVHPRGVIHYKSFLVSAPFSRIFASVGTVCLDSSLQSSTVIAHGYDSILNSIHVSSNGETLYIGPLDHTWKIFSANLIIYVGIAHYQHLSLGGNVKYTFKEPINRDTLSLELSGQAICQAQCDVNELELTMSGNSRFDCSGKARKQKVLMSGNASCTLDSLEGTLDYAQVCQKATLVHMVDGQLTITSKTK